MMRGKDMLRSLFQKMPPSLVVVFGVFLLMPLRSVLFFDWPWRYVAGKGGAEAAFFLFSNWIGPLLICAALFSRSFVLVLFFAAEAAAISSNAVLNLDGQMGEGQVLRLLLLALMVGFGLLLIDRDMLYPYLSNYNRRWRKATRILANFPTIITDKKTAAKSMAMLQDCSLTGIGLFVYESPENCAFLSDCKAGDTVVIDLAKGVGTIDGALMWKNKLDQVHQLGIAITDSVQISRHLAEAPMPGSGRLARWLIVQWVNPVFRRTALVIWALSAFGSLGIPSCGGELQAPTAEPGE